MIKNFILFQLGKFLTAIVLILLNVPSWATSVDSKIRDRIVEFNETLPVDLGEGVRMLSVVVLDDKVLYGGQERKVIHWGFEYSFYDKYAEKIKILKLERISKIVSLCDFSLAKSAIKINYVFKFSFYDILNNQLVEFFVGRDECERFALTDLSLNKFEKNWTDAHKEILPVRLDQITEIIEIGAKDKVVQYVTRLLAFKKKDLGASAASFLSEHSQQSFCNSPDLKPLFSRGFSISNIFVDKDMIEIVRSNTVSADCQ